MHIGNLGVGHVPACPVWVVVEAAAHLTHGLPYGLREFVIDGQRAFGLFSTRERADAAIAAAGTTGRMAVEVADPGELRDYLVWFENHGGRHVAVDLGSPGGGLFAVGNVIAGLPGR